MKKSILFLLIFFTKFSFSQLYTVSEKEVKAPSEYYNSFVLQMDNGSTVLLQANPKLKGFDLNLYSPLHEQTVSSKIKLENIKYIEDVFVLQLIELDNKAVLFYVSVKDEIANYFRMSIDPSSGEQKNELLFSKQATGLSFMYMDACFFKILKDPKNPKYTIISGFPENENGFTLNIDVYNTSGNGVLSKQSQTYKDYFRIELLDVIMDNANIYLCLNKKIRPQDSEKKGFFNPVEVNYIPQNKVFVYKCDATNKISEKINLELPKHTYSTKAQFTIDQKNGSLNMLLSAISLEEVYARTPHTLNILYKFHLNDLRTKFSKEMTNQYAYNKFTQRYPASKVNKNTFVNFPQYMHTDSSGNNIFLHQTVFNHYNKQDAIFSDLVQEEFAVSFCNSEIQVNDLKFSPYYYNAGGGGDLNRFSFACNDNWLYKRCNTASYDIDPYHFNTFELKGKIVLIYNLHPKNIDCMRDVYLLNRDEGHVMPAITIIDKQHSVSETIFKDESHNKLRLNSNISSFNQVGKTFVTLAIEGRSAKRRLVWITFN